MHNLSRAREFTCTFLEFSCLLARRDSPLSLSHGPPSRASVSPPPVASNGSHSHHAAHLHPAYSACLCGIERVTDGTQSRAFGATIRRHRLPEVALRCRISLSKPISLLAVAHRCCVLRSGWCQRWCQTVSLTTALVRLVAPGTSSGAATLSKIKFAKLRLPSRHHEKKLYSTLPQAVYT